MGFSESQLDVRHNVTFANDIFESSLTPVSASTSSLLSQGPATKVPPANESTEGEMQFGTAHSAESAATQSGHTEDAAIAFGVESANAMQTACLRHAAATASLAVNSGSDPVAHKTDLPLICNEG
jgi:hypothetical protein